MPDKIFFVTGTDTNVGKTLVSLLLLLFFKVKGFNCGYMKPVETGVETGNDGSKKYLDGLYVKTVAGLDTGLEEISPFTFNAPLAPYPAAKLENKKLCLKDIILKFEDLRLLYDRMIVEGAGGMLVPIKKDHFIIDLADYIGASLILVSRAGLGMLNHTLLSVEYAKKRGIKVAGIVINNVLNEKDESVFLNRDVLAEFTDVPIIGNIPFLEGIDLKNAESLKEISLKYMDTADILM